MIERFNFYDVYGYFIPGACLIGVFWFPHALVTEPPSSVLAATVLGVIAAYVAGHILQIPAAKVLTSWDRIDGKYRAPSDLLLDPVHSKFSKEFRERVAAKIKTTFDLDVSDANDRRAAFFLCRSSVIGSKTASYVEQFQGMYVLMRGICAATAIGAAYTVGSLITPLVSNDRRYATILLMIAAGAGMAAYATMDLKPHDRKHRFAYGALVLFAVFCAGSLANSRGVAGTTSILWTAVFVYILVCFWTFGAYHVFAQTWTENVYQQFYLTKESRDSNEPE